MKNQVKAIVSDFDGTIAGKDGVISSKVIASIKKWVSLGNNFSIASGKQFAHLKDACQILGLTSPQIVRGGAEIIDPKTGKIIHAEYLNEDDLKKLLSILQQTDIPFTVEKEEFFYTPSGELPDPTRNFICKPLSELTFDKVPKIVLWVNNIEEKIVEDFIEQNVTHKFHTIHAIKSYTPFNKLWDITSEKATKHQAVLKLSVLVGIEPYQMAGVGDGYNDYPLLTACGYKIAMGNSHKELKDLADFIAPSYDQDGFATVIEHLLS